MEEALKKAFTWLAPICALVTGLALTVPEPAAASVARPVSQSAYTAFKNAALNGVLAVSARDVWAVGANDNATTLILHWNGESWS